MSQQPRIPPLPESEWDETVGAVVSVTGPLNVFTTLARHPELFKAWIGLGTMLLINGTLPARDRELAILRAAHNGACVYEWTHHRRLGKDAGLSEDELTALEGGLDEYFWSPRDRAILSAADELHFSGALTDSSWGALTDHYDEKGLIELVMLIGHYQMLAYALNALGVQLETDDPSA